jgi:hypothetical protein
VLESLNQRPNHGWGLAGDKCAQAIAGTVKDLSAKEFRSFATLNAIWGSLIKLVVGLPPAIGQAVICREQQSCQKPGGSLCSMLDVLRSPVFSNQYCG